MTGPDGTSHRGTCPLCGGESGPFWEPRGFSKCRTCTLVFRTQSPTQDDLTRLYTASWSDPESNLSETGGTDDRLADLYARKLNHAVRSRGLAGQRILDFGAGRGAMLRALRHLGAYVVAIEPFGYARLQAQGFSVFRSVAELPTGLELDGIVTLDVIEHLPTPWATLRDLGALLRTGGWMFTATPNGHSLAARVHGPRWRDATNPGHLVVLSPKSLATALAAAGFTRYARLRWFIRYDDRVGRRFVHWGLQAARMDGELRYLAWK